LAFGDPAAPMRDVERVARAAIPPGHSSAWNQALMDFAALQCTLRRPTCLICHMRDVCASANGVARALAVDGVTASADGGVAEGWPRPRAAAERRARYHGSTRYQRGAIVDFLRRAPLLSAQEIHGKLAADP